MLYRLAQLRESGVHFRIREHFLPSKQPDTQPSSIDVSLVTVAPILVLLAAGNIIGILILVIEKFVLGNMFKTGCKFGFPDLQPGGAVTRSALQGPSGPCVRRFLQAGCRGQHLDHQYI